jgi:ankyrin repeat protein
MSTRDELAGYYRERFGFAGGEAQRAAHVGLWLEYRGWAWNAQPEPSPLSRAVQDAEVRPSLAELLARGVPLDTKPEPVLSLAVVRPDAIALLLAAHADPDAVNGFGKTPLMTAAQFDQPEVVRLLLQAGAAVDALTLAPEAIPDNDPYLPDTFASGCSQHGIATGSRTALMYAAANASLPVIAALLAAGADPGKRDSKGHTALDYLLGNGPVGANPLLAGTELEAAKAMLAVR